MQEKAQAHNYLNGFEIILDHGIRLLKKLETMEGLVNQLPMNVRKYRDFVSGDYARKRGALGSRKVSACVISRS